MISLTASKRYQHGKQEIFDAIDSIQKLGRIKRELGSFTIARNETGLQIIDTSFSFIVMKFATRLRYTTRPDRFTELKQIKGAMKNYTCTYTIQDAGIESEVTINLTIKLPYGPLGFLISLPSRPLYGFRLKRELKLLGKILAK